MSESLNDIFVKFTDDELEDMFNHLAQWCESGGYLHDLVDPSDVFEQFKYLMEVREIAIAEVEGEQ